MVFATRLRGLHFLVKFLEAKFLEAKFLEAKLLAFVKLRARFPK